MNIPHHVAIIPDGNRRWARKQNLPTFAGHQSGFETLIKISKKAREMGIKVFTVWAFSTENWNRKNEEIEYLMSLYETMIDKYIDDATKNEVRIIHLGRKDRINKRLRNKITNAESKTEKFNKYYLCIGLDYGGGDELIRAFQKLKIKQIKNLSKENINNLLDTKEIPYPNPDLIIRTGGEKRLSGFMSWQSQYSELMFVKKYLPDFSPQDFKDCIINYSKRQRRFGK